MGLPDLLAPFSPTVLWWLAALIAPCLLALAPAGNAQKGGRP